MHKILAILLLAVTSTTASAATRPDLGEALSWLYGYWELATDEDGGELLQEASLTHTHQDAVHLGG